MRAKPLPDRRPRWVGPLRYGALTAAVLVGGCADPPTAMEPVPELLTSPTSPEINPDGSTAALGSIGPQTARAPAPRAQVVDASTLNSSAVIDFNDITDIILVAPDRYASKYVEILLVGDPTALMVGFPPGPCDGSTVIVTFPFVGPYFLFNFAVPVKEVSIDGGDFGPSDEDIMTLTAYSGSDETGVVVGTGTATLPVNHATGCLGMSVTAGPGPGIRSATLTTVSSFPPDLSFPNSVFADNLDYTLWLGADIKPGSTKNPINPKSNGVVPVAILGSAAFDVADVDVTTLAFGPGGAATAHDLTDAATYADHLQDVNGDSFTDLVSHYRQKEAGITGGDTEACVTGYTLSGVPFEGCDNVTVING